MKRRASFMSKLLVFMLAFAVVFTYSVAPMNQAYAASKTPGRATISKLQAMSSSSVKVTWKKAKNAKKYEIYVSTNSKKYFKKAATVKSSARSYTVKKYNKKALKAYKKYYFKVRAVNGKKKGKFSKVKYIRTKKAASEKDATLGESKERDMTIEIDMSDAERYPEGHEVEVWVPLPRDGEAYQTVGTPELSVENPDAVEEAAINTEEKSGWNNSMAYVKWKKTASPADRKATIKVNVKRSAVSRPDIKEVTSADLSAEAKKYVSLESKAVDLDNTYVKKYAKIAAGDAKTTLGKAENIYNWVIANLERFDIGDKFEGKDGKEVEFTNDTGCGKGNPGDLLENFDKYGRWGGHCTDLNSCFVALCRANGIAAREMFGIRLSDDASGGQHCWAEFYVPGAGWTAADPGDVLKQARSVAADRSKDAIEAARKDESVLAKKAELWCGVDNNRVVLSRGRDLMLEPAQKGGARNSFGYPYAEMDGVQKDAKGEVIDCTKSKDFKYTITCTDPSKVDFVNLSAEEWAKYGIEAGELVNSDYLIDVRPAAQKEANGYVPGAVESPVSAPFTAEEKAAIKKAVDENTGDGRVVIVCVTGNKLARNAMAALQEEGVDMSKVTYLIGGFNNAWSKNYPVVAADKKSVSVPAWVTKGAGPDGKLLMLKDKDGNLDATKADLTHHILVNENGSNAKAAVLNTKALPLHVYNALAEIGGTPCDKFNEADAFTTNAEGKKVAKVGAMLPSDAQKINMSFEYGEGKTATLSDFLFHVVPENKDITDSSTVETEPFVADMRFGGCMENIKNKFDSPSGNQTGCISCTFSCWIGTVSNGAYGYSTQEALVNRGEGGVPAAETPVTVVYTLGE